MSVYFEHDQQTIIVRGKTYPYRDLMRTLGGQYLAVEKTWALPMNEENFRQISELCKRIGGGRTREAPVMRAAAETVARERTLEAAASEGEARSSSSTEGPAGRLETATSSSLPGTLETAASSSLLRKVETAASSSLETAASSSPEALGGIFDGMSIRELMQQAQLAISQGFPRSVWVLGEIQNFRSHSSGLFFQLADFKEGASRSATLTINANLWRSQLAELERKLGAGTVRDLLQDGMRVRILADVTLYKDRGQLSLLVQGIDPKFTKGSLALAREKLLRELRVKGLDRRNKELRVAAFPLLIGLISAADSRAQSDFLDQLRVYGFPGEVIFHPAQMQGEKTLSEVVHGLQALQKRGCDLIVLTRGGGSAADLRWFDSPEIAYAIAESSIPIIAAIGHHEDVCIAEEICFQREKTPTAAADFVVSLFSRTRERLEQLSLMLSCQLGERMRLQDVWVQALREKLILSVQRFLSSQQQHQKQLENGLDLQVQRRVLQAQGRLQNLGQQLQQSAVLRLQRGVGRVEQMNASLYNAFRQRLFRDEQRVDQAARGLSARAQKALSEADHRLHALEKALVQRDPQPWMAQGWTQLSAENEGRIFSGLSLRVGMHIKARLPDALLSLLIEEIKPTPSHQE